MSVTSSSFRWSWLLSSDHVAVRTHTFFPREGASLCWSVLLLEYASASVSFCWRGWRTLLLAWLEELPSAGVCFCWSELFLARLAYAAAGVAGGASAGGLH